MWRASLWKFRYDDLEGVFLYTFYHFREGRGSTILHNNIQVQIQGHIICNLAFTLNAHSAQYTEYVETFCSFGDRSADMFVPL